VTRRLRPVGRAPLAVAGIVSAPLFFAAVMASSLAIEKPFVVKQARRRDEVVSQFDQPTNWNEGKIWLLALAVIAIVLAAGIVGMYFRRGIYLVGLAGILVPIGLTIRLDRWIDHHADRFPYGVDLIRDTLPGGFDNPSNLTLQGEWEQAAETTVRQLVWVSIGLAAAAVLVTLLLELRRQRSRIARPLLSPPAEVTEESKAVRGWRRRIWSS
jgi:hypothetical protein